MNDNSLSLTQAQVSERSFLSAVYFWMSAGLAMTGLVAAWTASNPQFLMSIMRNPGLLLVLVLVQFGLVFWLSSSMMRISVGTATFGFGIYSLLNGVLFASIFLVYTSASIASTFFVTAGTFAAVSIYGFTTKQDLSSVGSFSVMALIGIIIASIVNWFFKSPMLYWAITYIGILIFIGLTAYDTQKLKQMHAMGFSSHEGLQKMALLGALALYLDFINLFLLIIRLTGRRR
ncbi:MAG: Bax inhibitor-1/YccA family protein [Candidatus Omnitrophica bacterium]|nr:Bax inhibitor-1/YccA family protein [Candidatus Omnitrophota bacterium]